MTGSYKSTGTGTIIGIVMTETWMVQAVADIVIVLAHTFAVSVQLVLILVSL